MPTWLHCEVICYNCWSMRAILCFISLNLLSLSFILLKEDNFSCISDREAFSCATSSSFDWLDCIWRFVRAHLVLRPLGLGPNPTPWIQHLCSLLITLANTSLMFGANQHYQTPSTNQSANQPKGLNPFTHFWYFSTTQSANQPKVFTKLYITLKLASINHVA